MDADEVLVDLLRDLSVAVDADVAPHHGTRREEVGRHVDALLHRAVEQVVEALRPFPVERQAVLRPLDHAVPAFVVVDAHGVVAEAHEARHELVGECLVGEVRREAEVHAVEPLVHAGPPLELKVAIGVPQPAVLAGGGVLETHPGEVERAARLDVLAVVERDPFGAARDDDGLVDGDVHAVGRGDEAEERAHVALRERAPPARGNAQGERLHPLPVVLQHQVRLFGEGERDGASGGGVFEREGGGGAGIDAHPPVAELLRERAGPAGAVGPGAAGGGVGLQRKREDERLGRLVAERLDGDGERGAAVRRCDKGRARRRADGLAVRDVERRGAGLRVGEVPVPLHAAGGAVPALAVEGHGEFRAVGAQPHVAVQGERDVQRGGRHCEPARAHANKDWCFHGTSIPQPAQARQYHIRGARDMV